MILKEPLIRFPEYSKDKCPFCGARVQVVNGLNGMTFHYCTNDNGCGAVISFRGAEMREAAKKRFAQRA